MKKSNESTGVKSGLSHKAPVGQKTPRGETQGQRPKPGRDGRFKY
jgi:hypothetical protein